MGYDENLINKSSAPIRQSGHYRFAKDEEDWSLKDLPQGWNPPFDQAAKSVKNCCCV